MAWLLINEAPFPVLPSLAKAIGVNEALMLQKIHQWLGHKQGSVSFGGQRWVGNIQARCQQYFPMWDAPEIKAVMGNLLAKGYLITFTPEKGESPQSLYVRIEYGRIPTVLSHNPDVTRYGNQAQTYPLPKPLNRNSEEAAYYRKTVQSLCRQMIETWNACPDLGLAKSEDLTLAGEDHLMELLVSQVIANGLAWEEYCEGASRLGRSGVCRKQLWHPLSLEWATHDDNAGQVIEAFISITPTADNRRGYIRQEKPQALFLQDMERFLADSPYKRELLEIMGHMGKQTGQGICMAVFRQACITGITEEILTLLVCNTFTKDFIIAFMGSDLMEAIEKTHPEVSAIRIEAAALQQEGE